MQLVQSTYLNLGFNYANLYDVSGTSKNNVGLRNPVMTGTVQAAYIFKNYEAKLDGEFGKSRTFYQNSTTAPDWNGKFLDFSLKLTQSKWGVHLTGNAIQIGSAFRSPGAQTKRIDFSQQALAYTRITNNQELRPFTMLDLMRESSFYVLQLRPYLMDFAPKYDNITPYGDATPNRQGMIVRLRYEKKYSPITAEFVLPDTNRFCNHKLAFPVAHALVLVILHVPKFKVVPGKMSTPGDKVAVVKRIVPAVATLTAFEGKADKALLLVPAT
jgi:hypothetical protein